MGTITARPRADGSIGYTAQIKIKRGGKVIYSKAATFDREAAAKAWMAKKEKELARPGALEDLRRPTETLAGLIDAYLKLKRSEIGKTKEQVLDAIKGHDLAQKPVEEITSSDLVEWTRWLGETRKPQTVQNYLSHLSAVFSVARAAWGKAIDRNVMKDATEAARHFGLITKSAKRDRRPTLDELDRLMEFFGPRRGFPMQHVVAFAIFSARRLDEIARIQWADLEVGRVLVRDMKHPGAKIGNDVWTALPPEAEAIARAMPKIAPEIFPFTGGAISAAFTRACKILEIADLHFHDLRHEGASRLFEQGFTIPRVAEVTGHRSWASLQRYSHLRQTGDKFAGWEWLPVVTAAPSVVVQIRA